MFGLIEKQKMYTNRVECKRMGKNFYDFQDVNYLETVGRSFVKYWAKNQWH